MITLTRFAVVLALCFCCGHLHSLAGQTGSATSPQNKPVKKVPGATVSGRVTVQGKGKGGVFVGIRPGEFGSQMAPVVKVVTDADGIYNLTDIPPGTYQIMPMAPAYVVSDFTSFGGPGKGLILNAGERVSGIDFSIVRGAVVTGKVTHSDGKPVVDESVYLVAAEQPNRRGPQYIGSSRFLTDDRGVYRMFGVAPGRYKVCIGVPDDSYFPSRNRQIFERVYYPSVVEFTEAKIVELSEGSEATNIDITVGQSLQTFSASGTIVDGETNQPLPNVSFGLQRIIESNTSPFTGSSAASNSRGEFRLENITPGKYSIFVMQHHEIRVEPVRFEIVDQDVAGLVLRTSKGAVLSGFVVLEGTQDNEVHARLSKLRLYASVRSSDTLTSVSSGRNAAIGPDGGFRFGGLSPGSAHFSLNSSDPQARSGFVIARVERDGVVQPRTGLDVVAGEQIAGIRIVVIHGSGTVRGSVKVDNGPPPARVNLMVRLIKTGDTSYAIRPQNVDARGLFVFEGVPGGSYDVSIIGSIPQLRGRQPEIKQSVTVTDGATTDVELIVNTEPITTPTP
jgi:protocatechuate 3,4-dioxygenase beta subunit